MNEEKKEVKYDVKGSQVLTEAIRALVNGFPGLAEGEKIAFATLRESGGLAMFPGDGAVVDEEHRSVTGRVRQVCQYPFVVLLRGAGFGEEARAAAKEKLDGLGRWLEGLGEYPGLGGGRRFLYFSIQAPAWLYERDEHRTETWAVGLAAHYENIFQKMIGGN